MSAHIPAPTFRWARWPTATCEISGSAPIAGLMRCGNPESCRGTTPIWGIASHDRILLALSACVAAFGALKVLPLISSVKKGQYQELLCTVLSDKKSSLLNRHQLTVYTDDQEEKTIVLSGRATLKPGKKYRIFLAGQEDDALNAVPDYLRPGRSLLGSEELEEQ